MRAGYSSFFNLTVFIRCEGSFIESTIHAIFFTVTEVRLDGEEISKSTNLELKFFFLIKNYTEISAVFSLVS